MDNWARWAARAVVTRLRPLVDRADRRLNRLTPGQAGAALLSAAVVSTLGLALVSAVTSAPGHSGGLLIRALTDPPPDSGPPPPHQPPRAQATGPVPSPPAGSGGGSSPPVDPPGSPTSPPAEFVGWAVLDRHTGEITGSDTLAETSTTASMIKPWLVADYLRRTPDPTARLPELSLIIRDSHNALTTELFRDLGEHDSVTRLITLCGLTDSHVVPHSWSSTRLSARDTVRMGACLADGRAAGPVWTDWLLDEMRQVRGIGDFGIRHAFPPGQRSTVAIKNGWVIRDDAHAWHVNCLAVTDGWAMGVLTRYPADRGYDQEGYLQGGEICQSLAAQQPLPRWG